MKRSKLEARSGILTWKWILEYPDQLWNRVETRECRQERPRWKFIQYLHLHLRQKNTYPKCEAKECTQKHSGSELSGQRSAELPDARHARLLVQGSHTLVNARHIPGKIAAERHQRRRRDAELLEIRTLDRWTRVRVQQIPTRRDQKQPLCQTTIAWRTKWTKITFKEDQRHLVNWNQSMMKNVPKKARVARNVFSIRGENGVKFDVNEEAWPNEDLAIRATCEGALIDGLPADKVKAGDEREIQQTKELQLYSWVKETDIPPNKSILLTGWARRLKGSEMRSRCVLKDFATIVSAWTIAVCSMVRSPSGNWRPGMCFHASRHPAKCSPDTRKDKNATDGFGDYMER